MLGKVWVANFMFTNCMGPCPRMTSNLHQVQEDTAGLAGVEIVSFTIDPANEHSVGAGDLRQTTWGIQKSGGIF